jgi:hypothetical protein
VLFRSSLQYVIASCAVCPLAIALSTDLCLQQMTIKASEGCKAQRSHYELQCTFADLFFSTIFRHFQREGRDGHLKTIHATTVFKITIAKHVCSWKLHHAGGRGVWDLKDVSNYLCHLWCRRPSDHWAAWLKLQYSGLWGGVSPNVGSVTSRSAFLFYQL